MAIADNQLHSPHYLKSVTGMGDVRPVITSCDIYSSKGVKLLGAGANVNSDVYEHLLHHKLSPNLDQSLMTEDVLTYQGLVDEATQLIALDKRLAMIGGTMPDELALTDILRTVPLNPAVSFKLTVMRNKHPSLFRHSLYVAIVSAYIGFQSGLNKHRLTQLTTAALLHDIGILHIDPALLDRAHQMSTAERHHLYAHPLTAWMIIREFKEYADNVLEAILQHHERLDGSGYPQGLSGQDIGQFGQMIAIAEIVASRYGKDDEPYDWLRLETILKLNSRRFGRDLVAHLKVFCEEEAEIPPVTEQTKQLIRQHLYSISAVFAAWESLREEGQHGGLSDFINNRMRNLKTEALDAGLNPYSVEKNFLGMDVSPRACAEASILLDETIWQIHEILHEIRRRWPDIDHRQNDLQTVCEWISDTETLLQH